MSLDDCLIYYAAPTLAGLKVAHLLCLPDSIADPAALQHCRMALVGSGLSLVTLRTGTRPWLYLFRPTALQALLRKPAHQAFLARYGYTKWTVPAVIAHLRARVEASEEVPHEVGLFLGYPLEDVCGFIDNGVVGCRYCGWWKVYGNVEAAKRTFRRFDACRARYWKSRCEGMNLSALAQAASPTNGKENTCGKSSSCILEWNRQYGSDGGGGCRRRHLSRRGGASLSGSGI